MEGGEMKLDNTEQQVCLLHGAHNLKTKNI
jgi:hypothetical protein